MTSTITGLSPAPRTRGTAGRFVLRRLAVRLSLVRVADDVFRPDVEGLRAIAVVAVLLFHARVAGFDGGFVGVDVFFVISGFLITRLLLRELAANGTISLGAFWARRARRLLPASCLVIVATVIAGHWMLPPLEQRGLAVDAAASATFVVNFVFANEYGDYFGAQLAAASPSPLLHFWSLAVEEQFYLVWPALLVVATRRPGQYRRFLLGMVVAIACLSFAFSAWLTGVAPTWAFYMLPPRMGELLTGATLAVVGTAIMFVSPVFRAVLGWLGVIGIVVAVTTYDTATPFPGLATLLPVLSAGLIIAAGGADADRQGPISFLRLPPMQWLGRHSYAIYLWHWPALVLAEARFGPLPLATRLAIIAGSIGLAALSVRFVEDPVRHSSWLAIHPKRGLAMGAALGAMALIVGWTSGILVPRLETDRVAAAPVLAAEEGPGSPLDVAPLNPVSAASSTIAPPTTASIGGPVTVPPLDGTDLPALLVKNQEVLTAGLAATDVPSNLRPSLESATGDRARVYGDDCVSIGVVDEPNPCRYGDPAAPTTVVLYGDSHAAQWSPPLIEMAESGAFQLVVLVKGGCPTADVSIPTNTLARTCPIWRDRALEVIDAEDPDLVIASAWSGYPNSDADWRAGLSTTMSRLAPLTDRLVMLGDNPPSKTGPAACLSNHLRSANECAARPEEVVATGRIEVERTVTAQVGGTFVDTTSWLCAPTGCPLMIGDILVYRDSTHLSTVAASWFRPLLEASVQHVLDAPPTG